MIKFENVGKNYKQTRVLEDVNFEIRDGELVVLIGPSGCGKTTTLKMINKLINPSSGKILINDEDIASKDAIKLRRNIGYVIQQTGLFPHMTIRENIEIIPRLQKMPEEQIGKICNNLLEMVGLDPQVFRDRYPTQLSGGQNQRVGVARAFATDPDVILMDEPFSAVDPITRQQLQDELVNLQAKLKKTIVFVTHDMAEAVKIADRICIMKDGHIVQYDTPENILKNPIDDFVTEFVGKNRIWNNPKFIRAKDIMMTNPVTAVTEVPAIKVIENMRLRKVDSVLVLDYNNKLVGIVTARKLSSCENKSQPIGNLVRAPRLITHPDESILEILQKLKETNANSIPVLDDNNVLQGLVTNSTLVTTLSQQFIDFEEVMSDE